MQTSSLQLLILDLPHDLVADIVVFLVNHNRPVFVRVEPLIQTGLVLVKLLLLKDSELLQFILAELVHCFNLAHESLHIHRYIAVLVAVGLGEVAGFGRGFLFVGLGLLHGELPLLSV